MIENYESMKYITQNPSIRNGKPCLRDTGIAVSDIKTFLASKMTITDILEEFSELTKEDVLAAKKYIRENE